MYIPKKPESRGIDTKATLTRVIDGDTFECTWLGRKVKVRLLSCWVKDKTTPDYQAARYLRQFIGQELIIRVPTEEATTVFDLVSFDRVLAWAWLPDEDESINQALVRMGWATEEKP